MNKVRNERQKTRGTVSAKVAVDLLAKYLKNANWTLSGAFFVFLPTIGVFLITLFIRCRVL